jgi:hypothetical protein
MFFSLPFTDTSVDLGFVVQHPTLPFAKVGRGVWIPIEMLEACDDQMLPTSKVLMPLLAKTHQECDLEVNERRIYLSFNTLMDGLHTVDVRTPANVQGSC